MLSYAAGALDAAEREGVRAHVSTGCPRCAVALAEAEATVSQIPLALEPIQPFPDVRNQLMDRAKLTLDKSTASARITPGAHRSRWGSYAMAACAGALLSALAVQYVYRSVYQPRIARADAQVNELKVRLGDAQTTFAQLARMIESPDLRLVAFKPTEQQRDAKGRILWDRERNQWHINVFDMKPPPPGQAYELWFFGEDKKPVPGPMLRVDATGRGAMTVDVPQHMGPITLAAFTNEPEQGLPAPTGQIHLQTPIE